MNSIVLWVIGVAAIFMGLTNAICLGMRAEPDGRGSFKNPDRVAILHFYATLLFTSVGIALLSIRV